MSLRRGLYAVLLAVGLLSIPAAIPQVSPRSSDLERIRNEILRLRTRLEDVHRRAKTAQQELEAVELELAIRTRELELAVDMEQRLDAERRALETQIAQLAPRIERQKKFLGKRLVVLYRMGSLSYLRMFLSIDHRRDPIDAMSMLGYLVARDARAVSHFESTRQQLSARHAALADRQKKLVEARRLVEERRRAIAAAQVQKQNLVASLQREESGSERQLADLEEKARRLERLVTILSRQQSGVPDSVDIRSVQGALPWPLEGRVIERFGRQRNARFNTFTISNGIRIGASPGAPVRAVFQGTVLFSQWFKGYGNLIIVDHGHRVYSLYGNLKVPAVAVGDRITAGQTIAGVGESEEAPPGFLYFEIRHDNRPEDPQKWLR